MTSQTCNLTGVPETMLWTLHNRASEAMRADAWLQDPDAVRIYQSLQYDYLRSFGHPDSSHAIRSLVFDQALQPWLQAHPGGTVVELACGLETQFQRCDDGQVRWLCVDVPESIAVRERFLAPSERCRHLGKSALDLSWMDHVDGSRGVFVTAQGLLMYFEEAQVKTLLAAIIARFPGVELMFDTIPLVFAVDHASRRSVENPALPHPSHALGHRPTRTGSDAAQLLAADGRHPYPELPPHAWLSGLPVSVAEPPPRSLRQVPLHRACQDENPCLNSAQPSGYDHEKNPSLPLPSPPAGRCHGSDRNQQRPGRR